MLSSKRNSGTTGVGDDPERAGASVAKRKRQKPMYQVLKADLEHAIRSGKLKPGELVPSESELIARYQVSSTTARRSLDELEADGLLERKRGKGTFVSALAKMLNRPRIAVVVKDFLSLAHPFLATVVGTIEHTLEKEGLHVVIVRARVGGEEEQTLSRLPEMLEHEGAQHVFLLSNMPLSTVEPLLEQGFHCLGVNTRYMDSRIPYVAIDFDDAFSISLRELVQRGHRAICNIIQEVPMAKIGVMNSSSILDSAYTKLKEEFPHLPEKPLVCHVDGIESLEKAIPAILAEHPEITAFRCWDELAGLEVMRIVSAMGLRVPEDLSIVGVRLLPASPLACVENPITEVATLSARAMLDWIAGEKPKNNLIAPGPFLARATIGPANC